MATIENLLGFKKRVMENIPEELKDQIEFEGMWQFQGSGTSAITGTNATQGALAQDDEVSPDNNVFFSGQIVNLGERDCGLEIKIHGRKGEHNHDLRYFELIEFDNVPLKSINVVINGTVSIHGMGVMVRALTPLAKLFLLSRSKIIERALDSTVNLYNGGVIVAVDLTVLRAALTSIVPAGFTNIRLVAVSRINLAGVTFNLRIDQPNNNINFGNETRVARGDQVTGIIADVLVSNAAQAAGSELVLLLQQRVITS